MTIPSSIVSCKLCVEAADFDLLPAFFVSVVTFFAAVVAAAFVALSTAFFAVSCACVASLVASEVIVSSFNAVEASVAVAAATVA